LINGEVCGQNHKRIKHDEATHGKRATRPPPS
jgi:hypothetical protein